jgi:hypothetical protein
MRRVPESADTGREWACIICDQKAVPGQRWFALAQDYHEDRLRIFHQENFTGQAPIPRACCPAHVQQLAIHWMVTGSLDYPFAESRPNRPSAKRFIAPSTPTDVVDRQRVSPICELSVNRDVVCRVLLENAAWLGVILEELRDALEKSIETSPDAQTPEDPPYTWLPHI